MDKKQISAVVIEDIEDLLHYYIVSHSDIIRFLVKERSYLEFMGIIAGGHHLLKEVKAKELMRGPIEIISKDTPIDECIQIMHKTGFKRLILGNEKKQPIGIISTKDMIQWNTNLLPKGTPFLVCVIERDSGLILGQKTFKDIIPDTLLAILGGSISAISSLTSEIIKKSGNVRLIEKDNYEIMLETQENIIAALVVDRSSITLRRKLQAFISQFISTYRDELVMRKKTGGLTSIHVFKIWNMAEIFIN